MAKKLVAELKENEHVEDVFFVSEKVMGVGKTGKSYLSLKISDKSGMMDAKVWDRAEQFAAAFDREEFVAIKGSVQSYLGTLQIVVTDIRKVQNTEAINIDDFTPDSGLDIESLTQAFLQLGASIQDAHIRSLFDAIFVGDPDIQSKFMHYPAAKSLHHSFKGGLLEHSLNVGRLAEIVCRYYEGALNRDVLLFSALAHDLGKIWEFEFTVAANYTDEGKLLGHIMLADEAIVKKAAAIDGFPRKTLMLIRHILASHHGEYEFGSPKRPKTLEALVIHFLDNLDAKLNGFMLAVSKDLQQGDWTSVVKSFDRQLYKSKMSANGEQPRACQATSARKKNAKGFNPVLKNISFDLFDDKE